MQGKLFKKYDISVSLIKHDYIGAYKGAVNSASYKPFANAGMSYINQFTIITKTPN